MKAEFIAKRFQRIRTKHILRNRRYLVIEMGKWFENISS